MAAELCPVNKRWRRSVWGVFDLRLCTMISAYVAREVSFLAGGVEVPSSISLACIEGLFEHLWTTFNRLQRDDR
jgi:hypothetical protein